MYKPNIDIAVLKGKTITHIEGEQGDDELIFTCSDGTKYKMYHEQDCCEQMYLEDVGGYLDDLLNSPILVAESVSNEDVGFKDTRTDEYDKAGKDGLIYAESYTWTFYRLATQKGWVVLRWLGESNGYYGEDVRFVDITSEDLQD